MKSLSEVQRMGVDLTKGSHQHREEYDGHPKPYDPKMQEYRAPVDIEPAKHDGMHDIEKTGHLEEARTRPLSSGNSGWAGAAGRLRLSGSGGTSGAVGSLTSGASGADINTGIHPHSNTSGAVGAAAGGAALGGVAAAARPKGSRRGSASSSSSSDSDREGKDKGPGLMDRIKRKTHKSQGASGGATAAAVAATSGTSSSDMQYAGKRDPNLVQDGSSKLTGSAAPGSHSAVFGLTKDGSTFNDTTRGQQNSGKIQSVEGGSTSTLDNSSRAPTGAGVSQQLNDPRVAQKGHDGAAQYANDNSTKPGAGANLRSVV